MSCVHVRFFRCHLHLFPISLYSKLVGLIALKIWKVQRAVAQFSKQGTRSKNKVSHLVPIIVESCESDAV